MQYLGAKRFEAKVTIRRMSPKRSLFTAKDIYEFKVRQAANALGLNVFWENDILMVK